MTLPVYLCLALVITSWTCVFGGRRQRHHFIVSRDRHDAVFEQVSMLMNVALWYTKHAAKLAGDEEYVIASFFW